MGLLEERRHDRGVRRRALDILAGVSLLACVAVCVFWVRGRGGVESVTLTHDRWPHEGGAASSQFHLLSDERLSLGFSWGRVGRHSFAYRGNGSEFGPFRWETFDGITPPADDGFGYVRVGVSHWLLALLLFVPPVLWVRRCRKANCVLKPGVCASCGYDLRATPDRCPECGKVPGRQRDASALIPTSFRG